MNLLIQDFWIRTAKTMKEKGFTQKTFCEKIGVNLTTYQGWIVHGRYPNGAEALKISETLNVSLHYLITGENISDIPEDIKTIESQLLQFSEEERMPIITMLQGQIEYWKKVLNK